MAPRQPNQKHNRQGKTRNDERYKSHEHQEPHQQHNNTTTILQQITHQITKKRRNETTNSQDALPNNDETSDEESYDKEHNPNTSSQQDTTIHTVMTGHPPNPRRRENPYAAQNKKHTHHKKQFATRLKHNSKDIRNSTTNKTPNRAATRKRKPKATRQISLMETLQDYGLPTIPEGTSELLPTPQLTKYQYENLPWGDIMLPIQDPQQYRYTRFIFQNINGIKPDKDFEHAEYLGSQIAQSGASFIGFAETNIDWNKPVSREKIFNKIRSHTGPLTMATKSSIRSTESEYQPGGTCTMAFGPWRSRCQRDCDNSGMGRWTILKVQGRHDRKLAVITAYRVCQQRIEQATGKKAFTQQWSIMRDILKIQNPDPRKQLLTDLSIELSRLRKEGYEILLQIDANESTDSVNSALHTFMRNNKLLDLHLFRHQSFETPTPATYDRGRRKIDFMFGTQLVANNIHRIGIHAFSEIFISDHRGLYVDLDLETLLLGKPAQITTPENRKLNSHHIKNVNTFKDALEIYAEQHQIYRRSCAMAHCAADPTQDITTVKNLANTIANDLERGLLQAERKCTRPYASQYSQDIASTRAQLQYWRFWMKQLKTFRDYSDCRQKCIQKAQITDPCDTPPTKGQVNSMISQTKKKLREQEQEAFQLRQQHLQTRAAHWALVRKTKEEKLIKAMAHAEKQRQIYFKFQCLRGKRKAGGLTSIRIPKTDKEGNNIWQPDAKTGQLTQAFETIYDPEQIEHLLMERNQNHFSQASNTPFASEPLRSIVGKYGENGFEGVMNALNIKHDPGTTALLTQLLGEKLPQIACIMTGDDLKEKFKRWRESTSTSPRGVHLGIYKALLVPDIYVGHDGKTKASTARGDIIFETMAQLLTAAFHRGFTLDSWNMVFNAMLEKIPGDPKINKLRVIHIFDALWNMGLGLVWSKRLQPHCEKHGLLHQGQWGSRKGRRANDCVALKQFTYEIARMTRTDLIMFENDAKSCYDRIVMSYAFLRCQQLGLPQSVARAFAAFLDEAQYHLRTQLGVSTSYYTNGQDNKDLHGPGQGNQVGPTLWGIVGSGPMFEMEKKFKGVDLHDPTWTEFIRQVINGFVDDIGSGANKFAEELRKFDTTRYSKEEAEAIFTDLIRESTEMAQWWENLLWATGGKLELDKCFVYTMHWWFDDRGQPKLATKYDMEKLGIAITVADSSQPHTQVNIQLLDPSEASKTLGVYIAPSGNTHQEAEYLKNKSQHLAKCIASANLTTEEGWLYYKSIYFPSVSYPLPTTYLSQRDLEKVQATATPALLNCCGFHRNTPRAITYAPMEVGGIGLIDLYSEQGAQHIANILLTYGRSNDPQLGKTLTILYNWSTMISGNSKHPFENPEVRCPHLPEGWISETQKFLKDSKYQIYWRDVPTPKPRRRNDKNLMDDACAGDWTDLQVNQINWCRLYLKIEYLSDICDMTGLNLDPNCFGTKEHKPTTQSVSTKEWPKQGYPGPKQWYLFKRFLRKTYTISPVSNRLKEKLGDWTEGHHERKWNTYYDCDYHCLSIQHPNHVSMHLLSPFNLIAVFNYRYHPEPFLTEPNLGQNIIPMAIDPHKLQCIVPHPNQETNTTRTVDNNSTQGTTDDTYYQPTPWDEYDQRECEKRYHHDLLNYISATPKIIHHKSSILRYTIPKQIRTTTSSWKHPRSKNSSTFGEYIQTLPNPTRALLENNQECFVYETQLITHIFKHQDLRGLIHVSDGGAIGNLGSFGWVIGTSTATIWTNRGIVTGYPMQSFRSEATGTLSVLWFYTHLFLYYGIVLPTQKITVSQDSTEPEHNGLKLYTDNEALVQRIRELQKYTQEQWYPQVYGWGDADIINEIFIAIKQLNIPFSIFHVKGHQDDKKSYKELPRPAQLNVQADQLATIALQHQFWNKNHKPIFDPMPHCKIYLRRNEEFHCSNELKTLRWSKSINKLQTYLCNRHQWERKTIKAIDWEGFKRARKRTKDIHSFTTKWICRWLAVNTRLSREEGIADKCPCCSEPETVHHLYLCQSRNQWKQEFLHQLADKMDEQQTHPTIKMRFTRCLKAILFAEPVPQLECRDYQEPLGWESILFGFISSKWIQQQHRYRSVLCQSPYSDKDGQNWSVEIITFIWRQIHKIWVERCTIAHHQTKQNESLQERLRAEAALKALYSHQHSVGSYDQDIFAMPIQERLHTSTTQEIKDWIQTMEPAIKTAITQHQHHSTAGTQDIRRYFQPRIIPNRNHNTTDSMSVQYRPP